ncbi:hypothetical protein EJ110_NYTH34262 [Nymphaea thermarum]|nr:hypothetical protein EJ110_NYTH34262 [Nymphaea thermarum]
MMLLSPKVLNQSVAMIEEKIDFFQNGLKLSLQDLQKFPGYLLFDLEKRVKPRHRIMAWLRERDLLVISNEISETGSAPKNHLKNSKCREEQKKRGTEMATAHEFPFTHE